MPNANSAVRKAKSTGSYQSTMKCHANLGVDAEAALNRFHLALDVLGFVPVFGEPFDGINALIYVARGDKLNATLSALAVVPGFGGAFTGIKVVGKTGVIELHHLLPQQFKKQFKKAGLDIEDYKIPLDKADHRLKPDGLHTGTNNWNKQWTDFFKQYPNARQDQILNQLDKMMKASGLK